MNWPEYTFAEADAVERRKYRHFTNQKIPQVVWMFASKCQNVGPSPKSKINDTKRRSKRSVVANKTKQELRRFNFYGTGSVHHAGQYRLVTALSNAANKWRVNNRAHCRWISCTLTTPMLQSSGPCTDASQPGFDHLAAMNKDVIHRIRHDIKAMGITMTRPFIPVMYVSNEYDARSVTETAPWFTEFADVDISMHDSKDNKKVGKTKQCLQKPKKKEKKKRNWKRIRRKKDGTRNYEWTGWRTVRQEAVDNSPHST